MNTKAARGVIMMYIKVYSRALLFFLKVVYYSSRSFLELLSEFMLDVNEGS